MYLFISPSKEMKTSSIAKPTPLLFEQEHEFLKSILQGFSADQLQAMYQSSITVAAESYSLLQSVQPKSSALFTYNGAQYQAIDASTLSANELSYLQNHLLIGSALYGLLRPFDAISRYRLVVGQKLNGIKLDAFWKEVLAKRFDNLEVLSLASIEYEQMLPTSWNVTHVVFRLSSKKKPHSYRLKQLRGILVRLMAIHQVETIDQLKTLQVEKYCYDESSSSPNMVVFLERTDV